MFENGKNDHFSNEKTTETSTAPTIWNKGQIYETEIVPKMKELVSLCDKHEIPFLFNIIYERNTSTGDLGSGTIMHQQNKQGAGHLIP